MADLQSDPQFQQLKTELDQARSDLIEAEKRIKRIEVAIWGKDPFGLQPDPDAMINILRDIRDKMPDLKQIADDSKFNKKAFRLIFGTGGLLALVVLGYNFVKIFV